jgi:ABC-type ATPase involved in cell division
MNPSIILLMSRQEISLPQAEEIMAIFQQLNEDGRTIVMITHEEILPTFKELFI